MKKQNKIELSIVIPAYREEKRIGKTLDQLAAYIKTDGTLREDNVEVIIVSADSQDRTHDIIKGKQALYTNFKIIFPGPKVGKGRDVKLGMLEARGKAVLFMDADLATPLKYIKLFYETFLTNADVVIAVRDLKRYRQNIPRIFISAIGNILFKLASGIWIEDSQCGFKLFSYDAMQICFSQLQIMGWGFDMDILAAAKANKLTIQTIHVPDWVSVPEGTFEDAIFKNTLRSFVDLSLIFYKRIFGRYKLEKSK